MAKGRTSEEIEGATKFFTGRTPEELQRDLVNSGLTKELLEVVKLINNPVITTSHCYWGAIEYALKSMSPEQRETFDYSNQDLYIVGALAYMEDISVAASRKGVDKVMLDKAVEFISKTDIFANKMQNESPDLIKAFIEDTTENKSKGNQDLDKLNAFKTQALLFICELSEEKLNIGGIETRINNREILDSCLWRIEHNVDIGNTQICLSDEQNSILSMLKKSLEDQNRLERQKERERINEPNPWI